MIRNLKLTNFRQHTDVDIDFAEGLNVLRGANESGKSTILEGILYALYGSKALRTPFADAVTWGEKESSLKVQLVIQISGINYTFSRSKSGAELTYTDKDGGSQRVTGQTEVSASATELLGADARMASMMMLSSQSGLRGALDDGPAAVSALMGKLANFDLIDSLVETAQATLLLGSDAPLRERLESAKLTLAGLPEPSPEALEEARLSLARLTQAQHERQDQFDRIVKPAWEKALATLTAATNNNVAIRVKKESLISLRERGTQVSADIERMKAQTVRVPEDQLEAARVAVARARDKQRLEGIRTNLTALGEYPRVFWEGSEADMKAGMVRLNEAITIATGKKGEAAAEIRTLEGRRIREGKCPTCGHDAANDEHVAQHNAEIDRAVAAARALEAEHAAVVNNLTPELHALQALEARAKPWVAFVARHGDSDVPIVIDQGVFPPRITWAGGDIAVDGAGAEQELARLVNLDTAAIRAEGEIQALQKSLAQVKGQVETLGQELAKMKEIDEEPLKVDHDVCFAALQEVSASLQTMNSVVLEASAAYKKAGEDFALAVERRNQVQSSIQTLESDIRDINVNNTLLKKLRIAKPLITDHLWSLTLSAVSNFFSTLRGETSLVTKDAAGFKVNGQSAESLSGSTLDVLALAIRVALVKTFVPHSNFIVLDEPAHGCDITRTGNVLGFLASVGFQQTLLASHDEISENVADTVIALESA